MTALLLVISLHDTMDNARYHVYVMLHFVCVDYNHCPLLLLAPRCATVLHTFKCSFFTFRLHSVCVPFAFRLLSVCVPFAFRLRSVCIPFAFRLPGLKADVLCFHFVCVCVLRLHCSKRKL
jgi:hypothetical protein